MVAPDRASRLRQSLCELRDEAARLLDVFLSRKPLMRGSVYELRRKCGKPSCACVSRGELHSCTAITWTVDGRKRLRSISSKEEMEFGRLTEAYRRFRRARAKLIALHERTLETIDKIELARRRAP